MSEVVWHPIIKTEDGCYWPLPDWDDTNDDDCVLVTLRNGLVRSALLVEAEVEGEGCFFDIYDFDEIKAWARFPDPYKGDEENAEVSE